MVAKIFKAVWFLSLFGVFAALLYVYADLPERVVVQQQDLKMVSLSRDVFFYIVIVLLTIINALVFVAGNVYKHDATFRAWFYGQIITFNFFILVGIFFINAFNSDERFDFSRTGYAIYGALIVMVVWAVSWPFVRFFSRKSTKQSV
jgi:O-antigen/teichoic acid export membrane protein